jgi:hypothetical protein
MEPQLMAEIRTRKMASTKKICEGLAKLRSAPVLKGKLHPLLQLHAIVSSPVFVGENLARFGPFHGPFKQQKYGHRQSLDGDPVLFNCMHQLEVATSCIFYRMNKGPPTNKIWSALITIKILVG